MLPRILGAAALICAGLPAAAATMNAVVMGTILSDSRTLQSYDPATNVSGTEETRTGALVGTAIAISLTYELPDTLNDPRYDDAAMHLSALTESQWASIQAVTRFDGRTVETASGGRYTNFVLGLDAYPAEPARNASRFGLSLSSSIPGVIDQYDKGGVTYALFRGYSLSFLAEAADLSIPYAVDAPFTATALSGTGSFYFGLGLFADDPEGLRQLSADRTSLDFRLDSLTVSRADEPPVPAPVPVPAALLLTGLAALRLRAARRG